jgi:micrococcal nuclease
MKTVSTQQLRSFVVFLMCLGGLLFVFYSYRPDIFSRQPEGFYRVTYVFDGDTIEVDMDGTKEKIRMLGVDTPETHRPDTPVQCFGEAASEFTTNHIGQYVRLESDIESQNRDRYGRLLRYVITSDGRNWSKTLVSEGYGFAYTAYPLSELQMIMRLEQEARESNRGLWGNCTPSIEQGRSQSS